MESLFLVIISSMLVMDSSSASGKPPRIIVQPYEDVYYNIGEPVTLPCIAEGQPPPVYTNLLQIPHVKTTRYRWTINDLEFNLYDTSGRIVQLPNEGSIVFNKPEDKDAGTFQCRASNEHGTSISRKVHLRQAFLDRYPGGLNNEVNAQIGHPFKMSCLPPRSEPEAEIKWALMDQELGRLIPVKYNGRIAKDLEGNLYFSHVLEEDHRNGWPYVCLTINYFLRRSFISSGTILKTHGSSEIDTQVKPQLLWSSPAFVVGLLGDELHLMCIFGGNPSPQVLWESSTGIISDEHRWLSQGGQELMIYKVQDSDEGNYTCYIDSPFGNRQQRYFQVVVKSKPYWKEKPENIETGIGTKAIFRCVASGNPLPNYQWYINGIKLEDSNHPTYKSSRFQKLNDNEVSIFNLEESDSMVLQCNASNTFGYVFENFFLNVLDGTESTEPR